MECSFSVDIFIFCGLFLLLNKFPTQRNFGFLDVIGLVINLAKDFLIKAETT